MTVTKDFIIFIMENGEEINNFTLDVCPCYQVGQTLTYEIINKDRKFWDVDPVRVQFIIINIEHELNSNYYRSGSCRHAAYVILHVEKVI